MAMVGVRCVMGERFRVWMVEGVEVVGVMAWRVRGCWLLLIVGG